MHSAAKIAARFLADSKDGKKVGDRSGVGLFIPLPAHLAEKFPSLGDEDKSPPHVTFLYIGDVPAEQEATLLKALGEAFQGKGWPKVHARLDHLDYFQHADKERNVAHMAVKFGQPMAELRDRVKNHLENNGINVGDSFPVYRPHATLAYMPGLTSSYEGEPVHGEWDFDTIEVWGLPKVHKIKFNPRAKEAFVAEDGWDQADNHRFVLFPDNEAEEDFLNGPVRSLFDNAGYFTGRTNRNEDGVLGIEFLAERIPDRRERLGRVAAEQELTLSEALETTIAGMSLLVVQGIVTTNPFFNETEIKKYLRTRKRFHSLFAQAARQVADFFDESANLKAVAAGLRMFANSNPAQFQRALVGAGRAILQIRRLNYPEITPQVRSRMGLAFGNLRRIADLLGAREIEWREFQHSYEELFGALTKARGVPAQLRTLFRKMLKLAPRTPMVLSDSANPGAWFDLPSEKKVTLRSEARDLKQRQDEVWGIDDPERRQKELQDIASGLGRLQEEAGVNLSIIEQGDAVPLADVFKRERKLDRDGPTDYIITSYIRGLVSRWEDYPEQRGALSKRELGKLLTVLRKVKTLPTLERVVREAVGRGLLKSYEVDDISQRITRAQKNKALREGLPLTPLRWEPATAEQFQAAHDSGEIEFHGEWEDEAKQEVLGRVSAAVAQLEGIFGKGFCGKHHKKLVFSFSSGEIGGFARASYFVWDDRTTWQPRVKFGEDFDGLLAHELSHFFDDLLSQRLAEDEGRELREGYTSINVFGNTGQPLDSWLDHSSHLEKRLPEAVEVMRAVFNTPDYQRWTDMTTSAYEIALPRAVENVTGKPYHAKGNEHLRDVMEARYKSEIPPEIVAEAERVYRGVMDGDDRKLRYYSSAVEIWARICEQYIYTKLSRSGIANPWLTQLTYDIKELPQFIEDERFVKDIEPLMDKLFGRLKERKIISKKTAKMNDSWLELPEDVLYRAEVKEMEDPAEDDEVYVGDDLEAKWAKCAGWWSITPDNPGINPPPVDKGGLMNAVPGQDPDQGALYNGDGPADILGDAMRDVDMEYMLAWGRPATRAELEAAWSFVMGPILPDGRFDYGEGKEEPLNEWFVEFAEWLGKKPNEIMYWSADLFDALRRLWKEGKGPSHLEAYRKELLEVSEDSKGFGDHATLRSEDLAERLQSRLSVIHDETFRGEDALEGPDMEPEIFIGRVASLYLNASSHRRSIALMKFLSEASRRLGVAKHVYVVGGAVRNFVIDKPIKDIDVVIDSVSARRDSDWFAKELARQIPAATDITTNQYGVAILTVKGDWELDGENMKGEVIEIANARSESYAKGEGYKPTDVQPATIEQDVYRREFTFNTLMWRLLDLAKGPDKAEIIDLTGCGLRDLQEGKLQCPSDPDKTFSDDPSRMLRAIKFTGKYGFKIPNDVAQSIRRNAKKMKRMPWEAIGKILVENVLNEPSARKSLKQMKDLGLLDVVSEMIQEQAPFAKYMANQLRRNRKVQLLLDLMDLGVPASTPLHFLDPKQRQRLRELTVSMPEDQASKFADALIKPPVNNKEVIDKLMLPGPKRRFIQPLARALILTDPKLADDPRRLTQMVIEKWK